MNVNVVRSTRLYVAWLRASGMRTRVYSLRFPFDDSEASTLSSSGFIKTRVTAARMKAGRDNAMNATRQPQTDRMLTATGNAKVFPTFGPDSLNPIALPCFEPKRSLSRALDTGR